MRRTELGLWAMLASLTAGTVLSLGSLVSTGYKLKAEALPPSVPFAAMLSPLALALEVAAIALIASDSKRAGGVHRRLALVSAAFFLAWAVLNFTVFLPLSFLGMSAGSLELVRLGLAVKASAALLQYAVPFLLVYGLIRRSGVKAVLWLALVMTVIGGLGITATPITSVELRSVVVSGTKLYVPKYEVDYTSWPYPAFLVFSHAGGILYILVYVAVITALRKATENNA